MSYMDNMHVDHVHLLGSLSISNPINLGDYFTKIQSVRNNSSSQLYLCRIFM